MLAAELPEARYNFTISSFSLRLVRGGSGVARGLGCGIRGATSALAPPSYLSLLVNFVSILSYSLTFVHAPFNVGSRAPRAHFGFFILSRHWYTITLTVVH